MPTALCTEPVAIAPRGMQGLLQVPDSMAGLVVFVNLPQMDRQSAMDRQMAAMLHRHHLGTLQLQPEPEGAELARLGTRLDHALRWIARRKDLSGVPTGLLGSRAGGAAALIAAARDVRPIVAAVSCGGCLDLAAPWLEKVQAPTLLVVAEADGEVLRRNGAALRALRCQKRLEVIPRTTWLFEEPGALASVSAHAAAWFCSHLARASHP